MFGLSFTKDDLKRVVWTFIQAFLGAVTLVLVAQSQFPDSWDSAKKVGLAAALAGLAAGWSAIKNAVLADGSAVK